MSLVARVLCVAKVVLAMPARIMRGAPARPLSAPWGKPTLAGAIRHGYESDGTKRMAVSMSTSVTYGEAYHGANALARYWRDACGMTQESTIAICAPNDVNFPIVMAACEILGCRLVLYSHAYAKDDIVRCSSLVHPDLYIMSTEAACRMVRAAFPDARVMSIGIPYGSFPSVADVMRRGNSEPLENEHDDFDLVVFSSGSTGLPKAIVVAASSFARNGFQLQRGFSIVESDVVFVPVPLSHVFGLVGTYATILSGATLATLVKYRPQTALAFLNDVRATIHMGVSTMFVRELRLAGGNAWNLSSLRAGLVAGASCPESVVLEFERRFGCRIMQSYGMSETAATLTVTPLSMDAKGRCETVGTLVDGAEVKLADGTNEILVKSSSLMRGVIDSTGKLNLDLDDEGYFHSGDVGSIDEAGMLSITGRIKDMIIRGGINIFPAEVERVYSSNDIVTDCCVVGYPDPELGERTCLCVIPKPEVEMTTFEMREFAKGKVEKCKIPDTVLKMDDFPHLGNGKIDKRALRAHVEDLFGSIGRFRTARNAR